MRWFERIATWGLPISALLAVGCSAPSPTGDKVLLLGFDGMDPKFIRRHQDRLPNLMRLAEQGGFTELETVMPPQSPVAWSTVITGMTPAGHGVFDFVHRDPTDVSPFSSMAEAIPPAWTLEVGEWVVPLSGGETIPLRKGQAFWELLAEREIPAMMLKMPTDFPPLPAATAAISGMGTPDMLGSFGTFQWFTDDPEELQREEVSGGEIYPVEIEDGHIAAQIYGPVNAFLKDEPRVEAPFTVDLDRENRTARIEIGDDVLVLQEGQWSEWVQVDFELIPLMKSASGIVRLYLKQIEPHFKLYVSPVNIDPAAPEVEISTPSDFAGELAAKVGPFYTQGMAEETKALSAHLLDRDEFIEQAHIVYDEEIRAFHHLLGEFRDGLLFYYFSTTDQAAHMLWGDYEDDLVPIYEKADAVVGHALDTITDDTIMLVISDHGFARFDREVHLNTWLMEEGFLVLDNPENVGPETGFVHVDWSKTTAYAMGLNGLYINKKGREAWGIVEESEVEEIKRRIEERILDFRDPRTDDLIVEKVYDPQEVFQGDLFEFAPDLLVGFSPPYRMSPATGLGAVPDVTVSDNRDEWIGDHCMAHENVPGVLFSNRPLAERPPSLHDIPVTVLQAFGVEPTPEMVGQNVLSSP